MSDAPDTVMQAIADAVSALVDSDASSVEFCDPRYEGRAFTVHFTADTPSVVDGYLGGTSVMSLTWDLYLNTRDYETDTDRLSSLKLLQQIADAIEDAIIALPAGMTHWHTEQTRLPHLEGANNEEEVYATSFATTYEKGN